MSITYYYKPTCPHCVKFKSTWNSVKKNLKIPYNEINDYSPSGGVPALYFYKNKNNLSNGILYNGTMSQENILNWVEDMSISGGGNNFMDTIDNSFNLLGNYKDNFDYHQEQNGGDVLVEGTMDMLSGGAMDVISGGAMDVISGGTMDTIDGSFNLLNNYKDNFDYHQEQNSFSGGGDNFMDTIDGSFNLLNNYRDNFDYHVNGGGNNYKDNFDYHQEQNSFSGGDDNFMDTIDKNFNFLK